MVKMVMWRRGSDGGDGGSGGEKHKDNCLEDHNQLHKVFFVIFLFNFPLLTT